jgi:hypothetical protein
MFKANGMKLTAQTALIAGLACTITATLIMTGCTESKIAVPTTTRNATDVEQSLFAAPDQAVTALQEAVKADDTNALRKIFGPAMSEMTNPDPVQRAKHHEMFAKHLAEFTELTKQDDGTMILTLGDEHWPFPIPLIKKGDKWFFDTATGEKEMLNRRIGHNEISAIEICHAYVKAQREYMQKDFDGNGVMEYAQKMRSAPGRKDGLYWEIKPGEEESPFGPLVAHACEEGYSENDLSAGPLQQNPFHGYIFRILKKQGRNTSGGKYDYVINGHMVAGFALLTYPAEWGNSGVMTFIVNQQGKVYQKNLGEKTAALAKKIEAYDPDETWQQAE